MSQLKISFAMLTRDISIWLDNYDDIFSGFDPKPYSERVLSDDFLTEVGKVCKEKDEGIDEFNYCYLQTKEVVKQKQLLKTR